MLYTMIHLSDEKSRKWIRITLNNKIDPNQQYYLIEVIKHLFIVIHKI